MPRYFEPISIDQLVEKIEKIADQDEFERYCCWRDLTPQVKKKTSPNADST